MGVIFQTPPIPAQWGHHVTGQLLDGTAVMSAIVYDPGEAAPTGMSGQPEAPTMSYWRSARKGRPLTVKPSQRYVGLPEVTVPETVLSALPDDARLEVRWQWTQRS